MALKRRHKFEYLTEEIPKPIPKDPQERIWKGEDSLLRSVLINSMEPQIGRPLLYAATTKDIWDVVQQFYSKRQNASRLYTLRKQAHESQYAKIEEADRVYDFLAILNLKFDAIRSRILGQRPTPSLMEVCSGIRLEEDRSIERNNPVITSTDAFATKSSSINSDKRPTPVREHCKKLWHTKDQCWKLHGRPPNSKHRQPHDKSISGQALVSDLINKNPQQQPSTDSTTSLSTIGVSAIAQSGNI
ncbi:uncharacterized protein LOC120077255 [Benincasa hispida]|uniref:uncharacterized protein LOC120077255 n=1 Tax=Benincasa hispida TaxID=102211 RepID=UPI001901E817|nr:uncharacterized protein LOC120077255 [Benincasa hispida]